jgi:hypothetical protein
MITMSVSQRIYAACQLDMLANHYGLTRVPSSRKGKWFTGSETAWRKLADDIDMRSCGGFDPHCRLNVSEGLHGRINKIIAGA